ncbi:MAG: transposase domain-containing protein, partial [Bacteroidales bacterium]|nr:transposase domain-containing protein [Bacteroidales bacterium]
GSCKKIGVNPKDWLLDVLGKIQNTKYNDLVNLLPKQWAKINN